MGHVDGDDGDFEWNVIGNNWDFLCVYQHFEIKAPRQREFVWEPTADTDSSWAEVGLSHSLFCNFGLCKSTISQH